MRVAGCSRLFRWLLSSLLWLVSNRLCLVLPVVVVECCRPVRTTMIGLPLLIVFVLVVEMMRMMMMSSRSLDMYLVVARYTSSHLTLSKII
jgi:hypothetical protein